MCIDLVLNGLQSTNNNHHGHTNFLKLLRNMAAASTAGNGFN
jgi:hypothetical protein